MSTVLKATLVYSTETGRICPDCSQQVALTKLGHTAGALGARLVLALRGPLAATAHYQGI
jgi:hypothetical protein